jgi:hypothetical protein
MDMPVPSVAAWEWLNWKFPRAVHAGETIYARWTLTQKRAPVGGSPTAIVVWRVDVHSAGGDLCAEGEVGASVVRDVQASQARPTEPAVAKSPAAEPVPEAASSGTAAPRRGRRRRRTPAGDAAKPKAAAPVKAPAQTTPKAPPPAGAERTATGPRRRRRRRSPGSAAARNGDAPAPAAPNEAPSAPPVIAAAASAATETTNPLTRAIRRLRRSGE